MTSINWVWTDPTDADFNKVMVFLDGTFRTNVTKGVQLYSATGLTADTQHIIGTRTVDTTGNVNASWVNHTARTAPEAPVAPVALFSGSPITGAVPLTVQFTDSSTGVITGYSWDFGDGAVSTGQSPGHEYVVAGTYDVQLTVTGPGGSDNEVKTGYITVTTATVPPVALFTPNPTLGKVPLSVQFTDSSLNAETWSWTFGDGATSSEQSPTHLYTIAGTYTATLTVTNEAGSASNQVIITVQPPAEKKPVARFTQDEHAGIVPLTVQFTDTSMNNPTSYLWEFGDGITSSDKNPSHIYQKPGVYKIRLTVTNSAGTDSTTRVVNVRTT
jgi:PKD repeat protein